MSMATAHTIRDAAAVRIGPRTAVAIAATSIIGLVAFIWPLIAGAESTAVAHADDAPWLFAVIVPLMLVVVLAQLADGGMDAKGVAVLGVLAAVITALRPLGGGTAGIEPIWAVLILGGRALGPGFGFSLGALSLFSSALITGGVGPWLPFQMLAAAWVGLGAGLLPAARGRIEIAIVAGYGAISSLVYGLLLNLWFWPFAQGLPDAIAYTPGAESGANTVAWLRFSLLTSLGFDLPRAALTALIIIAAGPVLLVALRRVSRKAAFHAAPTFASG